MEPSPDLTTVLSRLGGVRLAPPTTEPGKGAPQAGLPAQLGRYAVEGQLGAGGMGDVLAVRDDTLGRELAAKVVRGDDELLCQKFVLEAQVTGQLEHPGIVPIHELAVAEGGQLFFTMKRVRGKTLGEVLEASPRPPLRELIGTLLKVCDAVGFAHARGVLHRDLKPTNIMVGRHGEVLVMDWGLAKVIGQPMGKEPVGEQTSAIEPIWLAAPRQAMATLGRLLGLEGEQPRDEATVLTIQGRVMGTPAYMPPEQALGQHDQLDQRADVYALGAILYQLLTGRPPYRGESSMDVLRQVVAGPPTPPTALADDTPWELEAVTLRAMASDPADRYPNVQALRADLLRYLDGHTLQAASYTVAQLAVRWLHRYRLWLAAAALAAAALAAGAGWVGWRYVDGLRQQQRQRLEDTLRSIPKDAADEIVAAWRARQASDAAETEREREHRSQILQAHLRALSALNRQRRESWAAPLVADHRARIQRDLGRIALAGGDLTLAEHAFRELAGLGIKQAEIDALLAEVETARAQRDR